MNGQMEARINRCTNKLTDEVSWVIQKKSHLMHHEQCTSVMVISARELAHQKSFRKAVKTGRSSRKLLAEAGRELTMCMGNVKPWTLYRAKNKVLTPTEQQYKEDFKKMDQWMSEFCTINPNSQISEKIDLEANSFEGIFIMHHQFIWANLKCGLGFHAVDTCHLYHPIYTGRLWVLCARDSDNKIIVLAYALTPSEDKNGAVDFGDFCAAFPHLKEMLQKGVMYTDGGPALPAFQEYFDAAKQKRCMQHLIG